MPEFSRSSPLRNRNAHILCAHTRKIVLDAHQFAGVGVGQRMQQGCVHDAVDGRGGSDAQRDGGDGHESKARGFSQHAQRVLQVKKKILDERQTLLGVMVFPYCFRRAEFERGLPPRLGG